MRTFDERNKDVYSRLEKKRRARRRAYGAVALCCVLAIALVLFVPFRNTPPSMAKYSGSPYYSLICKINDYLYEPPEFANRFEMLASNLQNELAAKGDSLPGDVIWEAPVASPDGMGQSSGQSVEVTDNQVAGVSEGDLFKRTDRYLFYLNRDLKRVEAYSIEQDQSKLVGSYELLPGQDGAFYYNWPREMFLSEDGQTLTLLLSNETKAGVELSIVNLDVRDPSNIQETGLVRMDGRYITARLVNGQLLVMTNLSCPNVDLEKPESFVPSIHSAAGDQLIDAEKIQAPDQLTSLRYTVLAMLDQKSLEVTDTAAFLSFSDTMYVSGAHIYATRQYSQDGEGLRKTMTQISCLGYGPAGFTDCGSVNVEGSVKNQYSMDEQDGVLRVVTSTSESAVQPTDGFLYEPISAPAGRNVSLYCYSVADWSLVAQVEKFAPEGDQAASVRFDGNKLYVCTAIVVQLTDPVYFFDLSDYNNIQYTDTGVIGGYSSSLVQFGGSLLGIGYGDNRELKVEIYEQGQDRVEPIFSYTRRASFSEDYKSYFIDRENRLVGLAVEDWDSGDMVYLLLHYDGYEVRELLCLTLDPAGVPSEVRSTMIDGWLYILGDGIKTEKIM